MEWCLTKKTCATVEIATALLDRVEGQEVEVEVLGVGITDIQSTRGKIEGSEIAGVVTKANEEMIIVVFVGGFDRRFRFRHSLFSSATGFLESEKGDLSLKSMLASRNAFENSKGGHSIKRLCTFLLRYVL